MSIPNPVTVTQATAPVVNISDITSGTVAGSGVFDTLMRAVNAQIESQYEQQRISGSDYSALYTEVLKHTMSLSVDTNFLKQKQAYELTLMERQISLAEEEIQIAVLNQDKIRADIDLTTEQTAAITKDIELKQQQILLAAEEVLIAKAKLINIPKEGLVLDKQSEQLEQQTANLTLEADNIPKQGLMIDKQTAQVNQQTSNLVAESLNIPKQGLMLDKQALQTEQQTSNLLAESLNIPKQGLMIDTQTSAIDKDIEIKEEQILISKEEVLTAKAKLINIPKEGLLLDKQATQLDQQTTNLEAEFDNILKQGVQLDSQVNEILSKINMTKQQIENLNLEATNIPKQGILINEQTSAIAKDIEIKKEQILISKEEVLIAKAKLANIPKEGLLLDKQATQLEATTSHTAQQTANLLAESLNIPKQGLMIDTQTAAINKDIDLKEEQINIALQEVLIATAKLVNIPKEGLLLDAEEDIKIKQLAVMDSQILNQDVQTELYNQKTLTEKANTDGTVIGTGSLLDAQRLLVLEQKLGFERDSIQKVSKLLMDAWAVRFNELPDLAAGADTALHNNNIEAVVEKLMNSVNVTPTAPPP